MMNDDKEFELRWKDEQIAEIQACLAGTIIEKGSYNTYERKWEINYSSILNRLIQEAGRWCEHFASDLFVLWKYNIDKKLDDGTLDTENFVFAFRQGGVDGNSYYEKRKGEHYYYRSVWFLDVTVIDGKIEMKLHK